MVTQVIVCRSNPIAPDPRVTKTASTLANAGYRVTLLGWDRTGEFLSEEQVNGLLCKRLSILAPFGKGLGNLWGLLRWQWSLLLWLWQHRSQFDIVHACDFDTVLPALICKWFLGKRVVYDIFDFYADHLRSTPKWIKNLIRGVDLKVIGMVDALILADELRWKQIAGAKPRASTVIYNTPLDQPHLTHMERIAEPPDTLHVVYVGLLQIERGLLDLLALMKNNPTWQLELAGFGGDQQAILAHAGDLPNVYWHGRVNYPRALALSKNADVVWALYDPSISNHAYASPNKLFEAMMLGVPVIVAQHTHIDQIVTHQRCGLVAPYGDLPALDAALSSLQRDPQLRLKLGQNGRQAYEQQYHWEKMEARLLHLYAQL